MRRALCDSLFLGLVVCLSNCIDWRFDLCSPGLCHQLAFLSSFFSPASQQHAAGVVCVQLLTVAKNSSWTLCFPTLIMSQYKTKSSSRVEVWRDCYSAWEQTLLNPDTFVFALQPSVCFIVQPYGLCNEWSCASFVSVPFLTWHMVQHTIDRPCNKWCN